MNNPLRIQEFLKLARKFPVIDVRSPGEFEQGHIPGAFNVPLFDNEERAKVGTAYVQIGREEAVRIGFELANPKIDSLIRKVSEITNTVPKSKPQTATAAATVLVHCWRGGMRSAKIADLLNTHGYNTHTLVRGYKAYRNFVLESFNENNLRNLEIFIVGGETGSGKTEILKNISGMGEQVIDLEAIAHHKGSAFGALGEKPQPTFEHFENKLCHAFSTADSSKRIWLEDESRNIGRVQLPLALWEKMKQATIFRVSVPKEQRITRLLNDYGNFSKEELKESVLKIQQRLGPQHVKQALEELERGNLAAVTDITLTYYDKSYNYNHEKRGMKNIFRIDCENADPSLNAKKILEFANQRKTKPYEKHETGNPGFEK